MHDVIQDIKIRLAVTESEMDQTKDDIKDLKHTINDLSKTIKESTDKLTYWLLGFGGTVLIFSLSIIFKK